MIPPPSIRSETLYISTQFELILGAFLRHDEYRAFESYFFSQFFDTSQELLPKMVLNIEGSWHCLSVLSTPLIIFCRASSLHRLMNHQR